MTVGTAAAASEMAYNKKRPAIPRTCLKSIAVFIQKSMIHLIDFIMFGMFIWLRNADYSVWHVDPDIRPSFSQILLVWKKSLYSNVCCIFDSLLQEIQTILSEIDAADTAVRSPSSATAHTPPPLFDVALVTSVQVVVVEVWVVAAVFPGVVWWNYIAGRPPCPQVATYKIRCRPNHVPQQARLSCLLPLLIVPVHDPLLELVDGNLVSLLIGFVCGHLV